MKRPLFFLLSATACASFSGNHAIMLEFGPRLEKVARQLRSGDVRGAEVAAAEFNAYFAGEDYKSYVKEQEPNAKTRWLQLAEFMQHLEDEAAAGRLEEAKGHFTKTRDACLSCHYITRLGEKRPFLDEEIPDITQIPLAEEGR